MNASGGLVLDSGGRVRRRRVIPVGLARFRVQRRCPVYNRSNMLCLWFLLLLVAVQAYAQSSAETRKFIIEKGKGLHTVRTKGFDYDGSPLAEVHGKGFREDRFDTTPSFDGNGMLIVSEKGQDTSRFTGRPGYARQDKDQEPYYRTYTLAIR